MRQVQSEIERKGRSDLVLLRCTSQRTVLGPSLHKLGGARVTKAREQGGGAEQQRPKTPYSVAASSSPVFIGQSSAGSWPMASCLA
jgi:hypothetical protein